MEGPSVEINCETGDSQPITVSADSIVFKSLWTEARTAISQVFDTKTLQDLIDKRNSSFDAFNYSI
jgi:DNA-binding IscR family transcriptional regulator